jgi:16S rRNA (guanine966-N2)-methyltransferase
MRIISGIYGGRRNTKKAPAGVRPTADAVRESIFNSLNNMTEVNGARCLDIFAGTGAMGFEALSRGATHCTFIEKNRITVEYIRNTAQLFGVPQSDFTIIQQDAKKALDNKAIIENVFDICFLDPPYKLNILTELLEKALKLDIFQEDTIITVESSSSLGFILPDGYNLVQEKKFGETRVVFLRIAAPYLSSKNKR